ncbi:MAG: hypothetical protein ACOYN3_07445 [Acidimicrobiia bacterium]
MSVNPDDPVLQRRRTIYCYVRLAKRVGYGALLVAIITFFVALFTGFPKWLVVTSVVSLIASCIILPVPIVLGYGIRAATREDRARGTPAP